MKTLFIDDSCSEEKKKKIHLLRSARMTLRAIPARSYRIARLAARPTSDQVRWKTVTTIKSFLKGKNKVNWKNKVKMMISVLNY